MVIATFEDLRRAFDAIAQLRAEGLDEDVLVYHQGRLKLDELISGRWTLDQINEAIADTRTGAARRNVLIF